MKKLLLCFLVILLAFSGCSQSGTENESIRISLSDEKITVNGKKITNDNTQAVYCENDIVFYPEGQDFKFGEGTDNDEHSQEEADSHTVVHITEAGRYVLNGKLSAGQIAVDLGEGAEKNPEAVVTLILNGVDITCTVAPAVIFYNVYECGDADEKTAKKDVDTSQAGANVIIADGTENNIIGSYVAKIYESYELSEDGTEVVDSEKLHKYDAAFYSKKTMNINGGETGDGVLNIKAENEGLDSELHLSINGGIINIKSGNDGINTNEDNVSVTTINGGIVNIVCDGSTGEGDGIDSNGWLVINGGTLNAQACATSGDAGIDSDMGIYINGGEVFASGNMLDRISGGEQTYVVFSFADRQTANRTYTLKNTDGVDVFEYMPENDFTYLIFAGNELVPGEYTFWQGDTQLSAGLFYNMQGGRPEMPEEFTHPEMQKDDMDEFPGHFEESENFSRFDDMNDERPQKPDAERPQMPEGGIPQGERPEMPDGERPETPEWSENMTRPDDFNGDLMQDGEVSVTFSIVKGANQFSGVTAVTE